MTEGQTALLFLADPSDVPLLDERAGAGAKPRVDEEDTIISVDGPNEAVSRNGIVGGEGHNKLMDDEQIAAGKPREEEPRSSPDSPMTIREILEKPQFYLQFLAAFFAMLPGFTIKFNISVFTSALFHADEQTQSLVSFIYLFSYALARLSVGLGVGKVFLVYHVVYCVSTGRRRRPAPHYWDHR